MKNLIVLALTIVCTNVFANTCPNLTGTFIGDLNQDVIKIQQVDCNKLDMGYAKDTSKPIKLSTLIADNLLRPQSNGHYQKSSFSENAFTTQLFSDSAGKTAVGPRQEYSLYATSGDTWLMVSTYLEENQPNVMLYKKQP